MDIIARNYTQLAEDYDRIEKAIMYLERNYKNRPSLSEIAASVGLSEYHFQRLFTRWAGVSPKQFLQYLSKEYAKSILDHSPNLLEVAFDVGLSSPGRLHDLFVTCEAVTPGEYKNKGAGLKIVYGAQPSPFGICVIGLTERGICSLKFTEPGRLAEVVSGLKAEWAQAEFEENPDVIEPLIAQIFQLPRSGFDSPLHLYLKGTNFQLKVWEALLRVPSGNLVTYSDLSSQISAHNASRAVGNAVAHNQIAFIIPCHRVIRKVGEFGNYRWGPARKKAIVGWELAQASIGA